MTESPPPITGLNSELWLNMTFGGADGSRLPHLTRVVVYLHKKSSEDSSVCGFGFFYDDTAPEEFHGSRFACSQGHPESNVPKESLQYSFPINGSGDERITSMRATYQGCGQHAASTSTNVEHLCGIEVRAWHPHLRALDDSDCFQFAHSYSPTTADVEISS